MVAQLRKSLAGYGGGMILALGFDDFNKPCGCGEDPPLRTVDRGLRDYPLPAPKPC